MGSSSSDDDLPLTLISRERNKNNRYIKSWRGEDNLEFHCLTQELEVHHSLGMFVWQFKTQLQG